MMIKKGKSKIFISILLYSLPRTLSAVSSTANLHNMWWIFKYGHLSRIWNRMQNSVYLFLHRHHNWCLCASVCVPRVCARAFLERISIHTRYFISIWFGLIFFFFCCGVSFLFAWALNKGNLRFLCVFDHGSSDGISIWARKLSRQVIKQLWCLFRLLSLSFSWTAFVDSFCICYFFLACSLFLCLCVCCELVRTFDFDILAEYYKN